MESDKGAAHVQVERSPRCCLGSAVSVSPARVLAALHLDTHRSLQHLHRDSLLMRTLHGQLHALLHYTQDLRREATCVRMVDPLEALEAPAASPVCFLGLWVPSISLRISVNWQARDINDILYGLLNNLQQCLPLATTALGRECSF